MENKVFLKLFLILIINLFLFGIAYSGDILFHEEVGEQIIIYRVLPDGTGLRKIGYGLFPQWSPDKRFISYVDTKTFGEFAVMDLKGKEIFRIKEKEIENLGSIIRYGWNPKSKGIAIVTAFGRHEGSVSYYDIETKRIKTLHKAEFKDLDEALIATTLEWSPDGKLILFSPGSILTKGQGITLINIKTGTIKTLSDIGTLPRFINKDRVLFIIGSEIWVMNTDGNNKRKLLDIEMPILNSSRVANKKIILQIKAKDLPGELPYRLLLLNLENNRLEEIKSKDYLLLCPNISPDGKKFTAVGLKLKNGKLVSEEEAEAGYYVFDLKTEKITLLKRFEPGKGEGFWFGVYLGYGNHTSWN